MVVHDPDVCRCYECSLRAWDRSHQQEDEYLARSTKPPTVSVRKVRNSGEMPPFLGVIHRHFEKAKPQIGGVKSATITAPLDMLDLLIPQALLNSIEELQITYQK